MCVCVRACECKRTYTYKVDSKWHRSRLVCTTTRGADHTTEDRDSQDRERCTLKTFWKSDMSCWEGGTYLKQFCFP